MQFRSSGVFPASKHKTGTWSLPALSGGLNLADPEYRLADNQSGCCRNVWFEGRNLCKRWGTRKMAATGAGAVTAAYPVPFGGRLVLSSGTGLYAVDPSLGTVTPLWGRLAPGPGVFFEYGGALYYLGGGSYLKYDGNTVSAVTPYWPTVVKGRAPSGGGTAFEEYNRLGQGVRNSFSADGSACAFVLTDRGLSAAPVSCTVSGAALSEGSGFTVNRAGGVVTFVTPPPAGTDNVVINFAATGANTSGSLLCATCAACFGGRGDLRVFLGGGDDGYVWSAAGRPDYFPLSQQNRPGPGGGPVTGFGLQNDTLAVFKSRSISGVTYEYDAKTGTANFPCVGINAEIGCDCPGTLALIDNRLTWLNSGAGVLTLTSESAGAGVYHNVRPLSRNINGGPSQSGLLQEAGLTGAVAADFGRKYWLFVNGHVWLWDYGLSPYKENADLDAAQKSLSWWFFDRLPAVCLLKNGTSLWFGDGTGGLWMFENSFCDGGAGIDALWKMKVNNLGAPNVLKDLTGLWFSCRADTATAITVTWFTDAGTGGTPDPQPVTVTSFDLTVFDLSVFTLGVSNWFCEYRRRPPVKSCEAFSVAFSNASPAQDLNVSDLVVGYTLKKTVKRSV